MRTCRLVEHHQVRPETVFVDCRVPSEVPRLAGTTPLLGASPNVEDQLEDRDLVLMRSHGDETLDRGDGPHSMSGGHIGSPRER